MVFRPNVSISLMQLGSGGKPTMGAAAAGGPFRLEPSTCFIDTANWFGLGASVCESGSCRCGVPALSVGQSDAV